MTSSVGKSVLVFANPIAGRGRGRELADRLAEAFVREGYAPRIIHDRAAEADIPPAEGGGPHHAAVSIGGDGTLRGVVKALTRHGGPPPPLLVVPAGTSNLMGLNLHVPWGVGPGVVRKVMAALRAYRVVQRDAATANGEPFMVVAGAGIDGQIIHELERRRHGPITKLHYALPGAMSLRSFKFAPITVEVDGRRVFGPTPGMAMAGNIKEHGIGFSFLREAVPDDGLLDVLAFHCASVPEGIELLMHAAVGDLTSVEGTIYERGRRVTVTADAPMPLQVDGEAAGFTPLVAEMLPYQIPFIVGEGATTDAAR